MPHYLYKCPKCESKITIDHPMSSSPTIICAECSTPRIKVPGVGAVTFKGNGWGHQS